MTGYLPYPLRRRRDSDEVNCHLGSGTPVLTVGQKSRPPEVGTPYVLLEGRVPISERLGSRLRHGGSVSLSYTILTREVDGQWGSEYRGGRTDERRGRGRVAEESRRKVRRVVDLRTKVSVCELECTSETGSNRHTVHSLETLSQRTTVTPTTSMGEGVQPS